jgi:hypothetical protein
MLHFFIAKTLKDGHMDALQSNKFPELLSCLQQAVKIFLHFSKIIKSNFLTFYGINHRSVKYQRREITMHGITYDANIFRPPQALRACLTNGSIKYYPQLLNEVGRFNSSPL